MVKIANNRCWIAGQRVHHGLTGCVLVATGAATHRRVLTATGVMLMLHDRADWRDWFRRERTP
jgi:hypothetical protein